MEINRRQATAMVLAAATGLARPARAEAYPSRPIKFINPFPVGISTDVLARGLSQKLAESLGQPVLVESHPGANSIVGTKMVARSEPDGYTMLITTGSFTANPLVTKDASYDPIKDFAPITQLAQSYGLVLVSNLDVKSVSELTALGKKRRLAYAIQGYGNLTHVAGRLFEERSHLTMTAVPYNTPNLISDVMAGTVDITFISSVTAVPLVKAGKVKALAITGPQRMPSLSSVPTLKELGYSDFDLIGYFGTLFPARTPEDTVQRMFEETKKALSTPEMKVLIENAGLFAVGSAPAEFRKFLQHDYDYQTKIINELGIRAS